MKQFSFSISIAAAILSGVHNMLYIVTSKQLTHDVMQ